jgi:hypothetical protein
MEFLSRLPWLAIGILWLAYALLGWYLAAHHIVWIAGFVTMVVTLSLVWKGVPLLKQLSWFSSQSLFIVTVINLVISLCVILFVTDFQFLGLIFLPVVTMLWVNLEMRSAGFNQRRILLYLATIAGLGIGLGEAIDLVLIPSMRW